MSILLNDDYEGGGFKFTDDIGKPIGGNGTKGTVIVFPSYHSHSVEKVTKGIRYSLVVWFLGKGFK
jgi:predicted 2-oxoglutarate/Fe(II)-dependent dioxygenase YbiX